MAQEDISEVNDSTPVVYRQSYEAILSAGTFKVDVIIDKDGELYLGFFECVGSEEDGNIYRTIDENRRFRRPPYHKFCCHDPIQREMEGIIRRIWEFVCDDRDDDDPNPDEMADKIISTHKDIIRERDEANRQIKGKKTELNNLHKHYRRAIGDGDEIQCAWCEQTFIIPKDGKVEKLMPLVGDGMRLSMDRINTLRAENERLVSNRDYFATEADRWRSKHNNLTAQLAEAEEQLAQKQAEIDEWRELHVVVLGKDEEAMPFPEFDLSKCVIGDEELKQKLHREFEKMSRIASKIFLNRMNCAYGYWFQSDPTVAPTNEDVAELTEQLAQKQAEINELNQCCLEHIEEKEQFENRALIAEEMLDGLQTLHPPTDEETLNPGPVCEVCGDPYSYGNHLLVKGKWFCLSCLTYRLSECQKKMNVMRRWNKPKTATEVTMEGLFREEREWAKKLKKQWFTEQNRKNDLLADAVRKLIPRGYFKVRDPKLCDCGLKCSMQIRDIETEQDLIDAAKE